MKKTLFLIAMLSCITAHAEEYTTTTIGIYTYTEGSNGYRAQTSDVGIERVTEDNQGNSYSTTHVGAMDYTDSKEGTYTTQHIGDSDYTDGPNGYRGKGEKIGVNYYYDDNK